MNEKLFAELLESVQEGGRILRGEVQPARVHAPDRLAVREIRNRFGLSQLQFAALLGISVNTLQNWEQGRRSPAGPARVLLQVAERHPEAVLDAIHPIRRAS